MRELFGYFLAFCFCGCLYFFSLQKENPKKGYPRLLSAIVVALILFLYFRISCRYLIYQSIRRAISLRCLGPAVLTDLGK